MAGGADAFFIFQFSFYFIAFYCSILCLGGGSSKLGPIPDDGRSSLRSVQTKLENSQPLELKNRSSLSRGIALVSALQVRARPGSILAARRKRRTRRMPGRRKPRRRTTTWTSGRRRKERRYFCLPTSQNFRDSDNVDVNIIL